MKIDDEKWETKDYIFYRAKTVPELKFIIKGFNWLDYDKEQKKLAELRKLEKLKRGE